MKKKILLACLLWVLGGAIANAAPDKDALLYENVIKAYMECHMTAGYQKLNAMLADDAVFKLSRGEGIMVQTKTAIVDHLKKQKAVTQNCECSYDVLAASDAIVIARVNFTYPGGVQENYLMLERNADKEWKIANVYKMFPAKQSISDTPSIVSQ